MSNDIICDLGTFSAGLESLVGQIPKACDEALEKAVVQSTRQGVKIVKEKAGAGGVHDWSEDYISGFSSKIDRGGATTVGEIGNKNKPGLVHLLEKGHATLTGRRTRAFPHMAPAFVEIEEDFMDRASKYIGQAIR